MPGAGAGPAAVAAGDGRRDAEQGRQLGRSGGSWTRGAARVSVPRLSTLRGKCGRGEEGRIRGAGAGGGVGDGKSGRTANAPSLQAGQPCLLTSTFGSIFNTNSHLLSAHRVLLVYL